MSGVEAARNVNERISVAKSRLCKGPAPDWVAPLSYDPQFKVRTDKQQTHLLFEDHRHAERQEFYVHQVYRLENMEAVHQNSQWRVNFEPRIQSVTLHHIVLRRGDVEMDHLNLDHGQFLQREGELDRLIISGWITFLIILEDVRAGDVLDFAYTIESKPEVMPEAASGTFQLPERISIGKYVCSIRFNSTRSMQWKSSFDHKEPIISAGGEFTTWTWRGENYKGPEREPHTPDWHTDAPSAQYSDCPDWGTVARAIANAWEPQITNVPLGELASEVEKHSKELAARIDKSIELIQDTFRYLSVNLTFGGQIPSPPNAVARRRYGDCKDLSFLLVNLLRQIGVQARPLLVHSRLRKSLAGTLPSNLLFNHVIVEFEAEDKRRWIDLTFRRQGGGAYNRFIPNYGVGLPIDSSATGLVESPIIPGQSNVRDHHDTVLVDTTGATSLVSIVIRAEGFQADIIRNTLAAQGLEELSRQHLKNCANRFPTVCRIGDLKYDDDRAANKFYIAEVFEIDNFMINHSDGSKLQFNIPNHWIQQALLLPENKTRKSPFALPFPYHLVHSIDVRADSLRASTGQNSDPVFTLSSEQVYFRRTKKAGNGFWVLEISLDFKGDAVPAEDILDHRQFVELVMQKALWHLTLPRGVARPAQDADFGELPHVLIRGSGTTGARQLESSEAASLNDFKSRWKEIQSWPLVKIIDAKVPVYEVARFDSGLVCVLTNCPEVRLGAEVNGFVEIGLRDGREGFIRNESRIFRLQDAFRKEKHIALHKDPDYTSLIVAMVTRGDALRSSEPAVERDGITWVPVSGNHGKRGFMAAEAEPAFSAPSTPEENRKRRSGMQDTARVSYIRLMAALGSVVAGIVFKGIGEANPKRIIFCNICAAALFALGFFKFLQAFAMFFQSRKE